MKTDIIVYGPQGFMIKQMLLTSHNFNTVKTLPCSSQLPEKVQICSFSLSYPMPCSNRKKDFEGHTLTDLSYLGTLYWTELAVVRRSL